MKTLSEYSGIIYDVCSIIAEYYNAIIVDDYPLIFQDEYINFKKINCIIRLYQFGKNDMIFITSLTINPTILTDTHDSYPYSCKIFGKYLEKRYKITNFFDYNRISNYNYYDIDVRSNAIIQKNTINSMKQCIHILDHELFTLVIIMTKLIEKKLITKNN